MFVLFKNILSFGRSGFFRKRPAPLADRLLADALRLAEIPSPSPKEEKRAAFVTGRLASLGLVPHVFESGSLYVRLHSGNSTEPVNKEPVLLFTSLISARWHPTESLSRLDPVNASGAGLADSLGPAALIAMAESFCARRFPLSRDLSLLFAVRAMDDPENQYPLLTGNPRYRPFAAIGVRGLSLGRVIHSLGFCRMRIAVAAGKVINGKTAAMAEAVAAALVNTARDLQGISWDGAGRVRFYLCRIEAAAQGGAIAAAARRSPDRGFLECELESVDRGLLDMAMNVIRATAKKNGESFSVSVTVETLSFIPPGEQEHCASLFEMLKTEMKKLKIKIHEEEGADPASLFSAEGIPSLSLGLAEGYQGTDQDSINIDSVEKGRRLLEGFIAGAGAMA
ncbi:hypothetical protein AGMMS49587_19820 [Spirochaetia bacterium]|nr:hypothetical protein AGMMS49587_19820 [Spirochaetia bacterium]